MTVITIYRTIKGFRTVNNDGTTTVQDLDKTPVGTEPWNDEDRQWIAATTPPALEPAGVIATLNVVLGLWPIIDAANAVGLTPEDLVAEAQAWALATQTPKES